MGVTVSTVERKQRIITRQIEEELMKAKIEDMITIKMLLLGTGECGKSTILKQLQILHCDGFSKHELMMRRALVYTTVINSIGTLCQAVNRFALLFANIELEADANNMISLMARADYMTGIPHDTKLSIKKLWADPNIQLCYERRNEFQLADSAKYFLNALDRIAASGYVPSQQDALMLRVPTTGVNEVRMNINGNAFRVFDVGGQRSERRKWIHCFDNVNAIIYIIAISEFDQVLIEDQLTNRLHESLHLFQTIINSTWFAKTSIVVFLNKRDLFMEKLERGRLFSRCFRHYTGENRYTACINWFSGEVRRMNDRPEETKQIYIHETCATDTDQVQLILNSVIDMIVSANLCRSGVV